MFLQEFYARKAVEEKGIVVKKSSIDHENCITYVNDKKYQLLFPQYMIKSIHELDKTKTNDYFFSGTITTKRNWVKDFKKKSIIKESNYGRKKGTKYNLDMDYFRNMSKSKFTLCPTGDCPWSYRFFEAIMCHSIPILDDKEVDILAKDYFYYRKSDKHEYNEEEVAKNYEKFIKRNIV